MALRYFTLTDKELKQLAKVVDVARREETLGRLLRGLFDEFLVSSGISLTPGQKHRVLYKPSVGRYRWSVILYDFIVSAFVRHLRLANRTEYKVLLDEIDNLVALRGEAVSSSGENLWPIQSWLNISDEIEAVPSIIQGLYFGYRRSSTVGGIIRFSMDFRRTSEPNFITFVNEYHRFNERWKVDGFGYFVKQTLYMIGHARNYVNEASLGLRLFAVRQLDGSRVLVGPLISMDRHGPIAARIVMVPHDLHDLSSRQWNLSRDQLIDYMIRQESNEDEDGFNAEVLSNLAKTFGGVGAERFIDLISNATFTVIKGEVLESERRQCELVELERRYRELANLNEWDFRDRMITVLRAGMTGGDG